jgi:hypothetical protein
MLSPDPVRAAFQRRSFEALNRIATQAPTESLVHALGAPTDVGALARILSDGEAIGLAVPALDPLAPLIARNAEHRLKLLEHCGAILTAEQAGKLIGISRQAIDKRRRSRTLIAVRKGKNRLFPYIQFDEERHEVIDGLPRLLAAMPVSSPWIVLDFVSAPDQTLGGKTPLEVLPDALWAHGSTPDGIAYQSRHDPGEICIAIFERPDLALVAGQPTNLLEMLPTLANLLGSYGKSITNPPP